MSKVYVEVIAKFTPEGKIIPLKLIWQDGTAYEITRLNNVVRAASLKVGGMGFRFSCIIEGFERYIFMEDTFCNQVLGARWFVEGKD